MEGIRKKPAFIAKFFGDKKFYKMVLSYCSADHGTKWNYQLS